MKNLLCVFCALLILSSCKNKEVTIPVESVTIDKGSAAEVTLGSTLQLNATVLPENATLKDVDWESSDPLIAKVSSKGLVTPVKAGEVTISATAEDVTAICKVKVPAPVVALASISLDPTSMSIGIEQKFPLKATFAPENVTEKEKEIGWTSDNEEIATVSEGVVTAKALGTCTITVKSVSDPTIMATCKVTVVKIEETIDSQSIAVTGISVDPETANILLNGTRELKPVITPKEATNTAVTWSTSDATIAEVSTTGVVTAKKVGSATITATSVSNPAITGICKVTVTLEEVALTGLTAVPTDTTLAEKATFELRYKIAPAKATNVNMTYETSDAAKATISTKGWVTAVAKGEVTLTIKSLADPLKTATCRLTIGDRVQSLTVSPNVLDLVVGQTRLLTPTIMPSHAAIQKVTWSSNDPSIATVSEGGEVTAVAVGKALITAMAKDGSHISGSSTVTVVATGVESLSLEPTTVSIAAGATSTLLATLAPDNATNKRVLWTSDRETIATVSEGVITARTMGTCTITARSAGNPDKMATCTVTVTAREIPVTEISITPPAASLLVKGTRQLTANILPKKATHTNVTWSTSNAAVAEVSSLGMVTAKSLGTATITVTSESNAKTATCVITVTNREVAVTGITATPADTILAIGASYQLKHTITPANATHVNAIYVSGDESKAIVSAGGLVTALATGQVTLTVKSEIDPTKTTTCRVTIKERAASLSVSPAVVTLPTGQKRMLIANILPTDAANKTVTWSSADESKATVSANGEVTAVALGQVVITATTSDGSNLTGRATVTVIQRALSLSISPANPTVNSGDTRVLRATVLPAEARQTVTWTSGDESKATINTSSGVVTGIGAGTVTITATTTDGSEVTGTTTLTVQGPSSANPDIRITSISLGEENYPIEVPPVGGITMLKNLPHTVFGNPASVRVNMTTTAGTTIKIGNRPFTSGQRVDCTHTVTFTVAEAGKNIGNEFTLDFIPYNAFANPYAIYTPAHLHDMRNGLNVSFKLMNNLTLPALNAGLAGIGDYSSAGWLPIGGESNPFTGMLDGAGHRIDNLYIKRTIAYIGLFGKIGSAAVIKNLELKGLEGLGTERNPFLSVTGNNNSGNMMYIGMLAGYSEGRIEYCQTTSTYAINANSASVASHCSGSSSVKLGGLVGYSNNNTIRHCSTSGIIGATTDAGSAVVGGLVGVCLGTTISDCYSTTNAGSYAGSDNNQYDGGFSGLDDSLCGGLVGFVNNGAIITRSYATGGVVATSGHTGANKGAVAGGLVGSCNVINWPGSPVSVIDCFATGEVRTRSDRSFSVAGGLVGTAFHGTTLRNCYATGNANAETTYGKYCFPGLLLGYDFVKSTLVDNCYKNSDAVTKNGGDEKDSTESQKGEDKSLSDMKTDEFAATLGSSVWGRRGGKNNELPYIKGVGVGR